MASDSDAFGVKKIPTKKSELYSEGVRQSPKVASAAVKTGKKGKELGTLIPVKLRKP